MAKVTGNIGQDVPTFSNAKIDLVPFNKNLNKSQLESIKFALTANGKGLCLLQLSMLFRSGVNSWSSRYWKDHNGCRTDTTNG